MYIIGLIDDEESELTTIRRTIKINAKVEEDYGFKSYLISENANNFVENVFEEVIRDIKELRLSSLIVDYKIMIKTSKIKGTDIFKRIKEEVPKFPVIILTEIVEESIKPEFIDADKVYKKKDFYKIKSDYSKEKVFNIFDSMKKYILQRDKLELSIEDYKQKLICGDTNYEIRRNILSLESELSNFVPTEQTEIDKVFDEDRAKEIVSLIEKANALLG